MIPVDLKDHMQALMFQEDASLVQHRRPCRTFQMSVGRAQIARRTNKERRGSQTCEAAIGQLRAELLRCTNVPGPQSRHRRPRPAHERSDLVEQPVRKFDDLVPTRLVVTSAFIANVGDHVRSVKSIIERTPTRIHGIEDETSIVAGHHELRSSDLRDLWVRGLGGDAHWAAFWQDVRDLTQKIDAGCQLTRFMRQATASLLLRVEVIDLRLQSGPVVQEPLKLRLELCNQALEARPEIGSLDTCARTNGLFHDLVERGMHAKPLGGDVRVHDTVRR
mmetsp:Transcript_49861/g.132415  ORF Transcript_49861/g.132415 Transcript_49861/m.132415 type:complete len:277 (+) Transcript_49861:1790-2620(+)